MVNRLTGLFFSIIFVPMSGRFYTWIKWQNRLLLVLAAALSLLAFSRTHSSAAAESNPLVASLQKTSPSLKLVSWTNESNLKVKHPRYNKRFQKSTFLEINDGPELIKPEALPVAKSGTLPLSIPDDPTLIISLRGPPVYFPLS